MDLWLLLLAFSMFWKISWSLRCYKCEPNKDYYEGNTLLCQYFDGSEKYYTDCQHSSMCFKRVTTLQLNGETITGIQRGCAYQTLPGDQKKVNGKWIQMNTIYEAYGENCTEDPTNADRATKTTHCYCRGDYCNSSTRTRHNCFFITLIIIILLLTC